MLEVVIGVPKDGQSHCGGVWHCQEPPTCELGPEEELWGSSPPTAAPRGGYPVGRKESLEGVYKAVRKESRYCLEINYILRGGV